MRKKGGGGVGRARATNPLQGKKGQDQRKVFKEIKSYRSLSLRPSVTPQSCCCNANIRLLKHSKLFMFEVLISSGVEPVRVMAAGLSKSGQLGYQISVCVCLTVPAPRPQTACSAVTDIWLPLIVIGELMFGTA